MQPAAQQRLCLARDDPPMSGAAPPACGTLPYPTAGRRASSKTTHSTSRMTSAPLYSMERRISVVMISAAASGRMLTSPVSRPTWQRGRRPGQWRGARAPASSAGHPLGSGRCCSELLREAAHDRGSPTCALSERASRSRSGHVRRSTVREHAERDATHAPYPSRHAHGCRAAGCPARRRARAASGVSARAAGRARASNCCGKSRSFWLEVALMSDVGRVGIGIGEGCIALP